MKQIHNIVFCSASKTDHFLWDDSNFPDIVNGCTIKRVKYCDNTLPITKVYNDCINENNDADLIVCLHDDVIIPDVNHFIDRAVKLSSKYDLIGLAGTKCLNTKHTPLAWHCSMKEYPNTIFGKVNHPINDKDLTSPMKQAFFNKDLPDVTDTPAVAVDGLCLILNKKAITAGLKFDETFTTDFYDMDLSFEALTKLHLKVGVMVEEINHYSHGRGILLPRYREAEAAFRKKWELK